MAAPTFEEIRAANVPRCEESFFPLTAWGPAQWTNALCGESGEAGNFAKKMERLAIELGIPYKDVVDYDYASDPRFDGLRILLAKELADTVHYADLTAARLGIDLGAVVRDKFNEVSERKGSAIRL